MSLSTLLLSSDLQAIKAYISTKEGYNELISLLNSNHTMSYAFICNIQPIWNYPYLSTEIIAQLYTTANNINYNYLLKIIEYQYNTDALDITPLLDIDAPPEHRLRLVQALTHTFTTNRKSDILYQKIINIMPTIINIFNTNYKDYNVLLNIYYNIIYQDITEDIMNINIYPLLINNLNNIHSINIIHLYLVKYPELYTIEQLLYDIIEYHKRYYKTMSITNNNNIISLSLLAVKKYYLKYKSMDNIIPLITEYIPITVLYQQIDNYIEYIRDNKDRIKTEELILYIIKRCRIDNIKFIDKESMIYYHYVSDKINNNINNNLLDNNINNYNNLLDVNNINNYNNNTTNINNNNYNNNNINNLLDNNINNYNYNTTNINNNNNINNLLDVNNINNYNNNTTNINNINNLLDVNYILSNNLDERERIIFLRYLIKYNIYNIDIGIEDNNSYYINMYYYYISLIYQQNISIIKRLVDHRDIIVRRIDDIIKYNIDDEYTIRILGILCYYGVIIEDRIVEYFINNIEYIGDRIFMCYIDYIVIRSYDKGSTAIDVIINSTYINNIIINNIDNNIDSNINYILLFKDNIEDSILDTMVKHKNSMLLVLLYINISRRGDKTVRDKIMQRIYLMEGYYKYIFIINNYSMFNIEGNNINYDGNIFYILNDIELFIIKCINGSKDTMDINDIKYKNIYLKVKNRIYVNSGYPLFVNKQYLL